jgi:hypothetical protein
MPHVRSRRNLLPRAASLARALPSWRRPSGVAAAQQRRGGRDRRQGGGHSTLLATGVTAGLTTIASAAPTVNATNLFLITPGALDFGYVPVGSTTAQQTITVTNVNGVPQVMSGTGGGAGVFGGGQNCQGHTLKPGQACHMFYAFTPTAVGTVHGSTSGT